MHTLLNTAGLVIVLFLSSQAAQAQTAIKAPETFTARAEVLGQDAGAAATVTVHINAYTGERNLAAMTDALKVGGYPAFVLALRKAPEVGYVDVNGRKATVRWARQQAAGTGRTISVVTDQPLFFIGGGSVDAQPRAGFELGVILMEVDSIGLGTGSMAPAARVKAGGATGVQVEDYGEHNVKLATVKKAYK